MDAQVILAISALGVAILGFLVQYFGIVAKMKERLTALETKVELFWKAIEERVIDMLKSPTKTRKDELLDKLRGKELNSSEAGELKVILNGELHKESVKSGKQLAYVLILGRLEQVIFELGRTKRGA